MCKYRRCLDRFIVGDRIISWRINPHWRSRHEAVKVERLIGTIRRWYLDFKPYWTAGDLEGKLLSFKEFYKNWRCHYALDSDTPNQKTGMMRPNIADIASYRRRSYLHGQYHLPDAA